MSHHPGVVALSGELDTPQFVAVHGALAAALADDQPEVIVNLSAVRFLDAGTIRLLLEARQAAIDAGRRLRVSGAGAAVRHVIEASAAGHQLFDTAEHTR